jgi:hypothetical protein
MAKIIFLNCTQHQLTKKQLDRVYDIWGTTQTAEGELVRNSITISDIKDTLVYEKIKESEDDIIGLASQVNALTLYLLQLKIANQDSNLIVHLPIGSPAFMYHFTIGLQLLMRNNELFDCRIVFSHSKRTIVEKEVYGKIVKQIEFVFEDYIIF